MSVPSSPSMSTLSSQTSTLQALSSQVGGHAGILTTPDGSLVIKPAVESEISFYQTVSTRPEFAPLRPFTPKFLGSLKLEGEVDLGTKPEKFARGDASKLSVTSVVDSEHESLVLENLSYTFAKPNVLDVKLGTVLHEEDASEEKRERATKAAMSTTSYETGVRLIGFQVYNNMTGEAVATTRSYGKSIRPADLPDGAARFFPVPTSDAPLGLPPKLLLPILHGIRKNVREIRAALERVEMRMVGGSILIMYEADYRRAEEGLKKFEEGGFDGEHDESERQKDGTRGVGPPFLVKIVDFAHTRIVSGRGPDAGVLKGLDTMLSLLDGRIEQVTITTT